MRQLTEVMRQNVQAQALEMPALVGIELTAGSVRASAFLPDGVIRTSLTRRSARDADRASQPLASSRPITPPIVARS